MSAVKSVKKVIAIVDKVEEGIDAVQAATSLANAIPQVAVVNAVIDGVQTVVDAVEVAAVAVATFVDSVFPDSEDDVKENAKVEAVVEASPDLVKVATQILRRGG